ncbi:hypothetical protein L6164_016804 [Bauhinia variegata]|uniref:Uncharacterized protein n=1 Tax=Bauhinia variegata TaxID=167791 RepID=A0ACB9NAY6_BAUVA|nr:hypothetical protein L6164_016804 [Bauhinia variegata]
MRQTGGNLQTWYNYKSLQGLRIRKSCLSLTSLPLGCFPVLKILNIYDCPNLKSISMLDDGSTQNLSCLETLDLSFCPNLESLPQGGLRTPNLSCLSISSCEKLVSCPQGGLPPNLRSLEIKISPMAIGEWGFQLLTFLSWCKISGDELVNALLNAPLLPTSLVSLTIYDVNNLEILDGSGIQHLSSLEELHMYKVKSLELLQVDRLPPSLKKLEIRSCPLLKFLGGRGIHHLSSFEEIHLYKCKSLESLPEDRLPPSLKRLSISYCPLLEESYHGQRRKYWSKIAHIPAIQINENVIISVIALYSGSVIIRLTSTPLKIF